MLTNHARLNTCQVVNGILNRWSDGEHVDPRDCGITGNGKTFHKLFPIRLKFSNVTKEVKYSNSVHNHILLIHKTYMKNGTPLNDGVFIYRYNVFALLFFTRPQQRRIS